MKTMQSLNKPIILFDIDYTLFNTALFKQTNFSKYCLYEEVPGVLSSLSRTFELGIFSQGEENLQNLKLKTTKIDHFFQKKNIHIEPAKEEKIITIIKKYKKKQLYIADDKLFILYMMKKQNPNIFTIWIKRGPYAENQPGLNQEQKLISDFTPDAAMPTLKGIAGIIDKKYGFTLHSH